MSPPCAIGRGLAQLPDRLALTVYAGHGMFWILYLILAAGLQGANTAEYCANSKKTGTNNQYNFEFLAYYCPMLPLEGKEALTVL